MEELLSTGYLPWIVVAVTLLLLWLVYRFFMQRRSRLEQVLDDVGHDVVTNLVLPNSDGGEILIDRLLLTSRGLLILEIKEVEGTVFGSDKMQDWTVIAADRRFTFPNPQPGLYDRIAAVRDVARQIPVTGRILFLDGAEFPKGVPGFVASLDELIREFGEPDDKAAKVKVDSFRPHWEAVKKQAIQGV